MPLPLVVVEVSAQDRASQETAALIEACTAGLGGGQCALAQTRNTESVSAIAIVSWLDPQRLSVLVEVARLRDPTQAWRSEELEFKSEDQKRERFRTIGLAIAALFRQALAASPERTTGIPDPTAPIKKPSAPAAPLAGAGGDQTKGKGGTKKGSEVKGNAEPVDESTKSNASAEARAAFRQETLGAPRKPEAWVSTGALMFYDPKLPGWRAGGQLQLGLGATAFPGFISGFGSYAVGQHSTDVALSWITLGIGPGLRLPLSPRLELRAVAQFVLVNVSGRPSQGAQTSRESVWVPGAGFGLELRLRASNRLSGTLSGQLQRLAGNVPIREHDQPVGTIGKTTVGITLSLELQLLVPTSR